MSETTLNYLAKEYLELTLCKSRVDDIDIQWYTEGPFWRRTDMRYSRDYKILPDYEIADAKHGRTLEDILDESGHLMDFLALYEKTSRPDEADRIRYLKDHVRALRMRTRSLLGEHPRYDEMTKELYGMTAPAADCGMFDAVLSDVAAALPGPADAAHRIWALRERLRLPVDRVVPVLTQVTQAFHDMACANMHLTGNSMPRVRGYYYPNAEMEFLSILFAYDYNHLEYERNMNLNYPWTVDRVMECIGHEMEPGHLTFYEKRTQKYIDTCRPEMAVVSQHSPASAFSEGAARVMIDVCFHDSAEEKTDFEREMIFVPGGLDAGLAELMPLWHRYCEIGGYAKLEATRNMWDGVWDRAEAAAFLKKYALIPEDTQPEDVGAYLYPDQGHFVAHDYARDVVRAYFRQKAPSIGGKWALYEELCGGYMFMDDMEDVYRLTPTSSTRQADSRP